MAPGEAGGQGGGGRGPIPHQQRLRCVLCRCTRSWDLFFVSVHICLVEDYVSLTRVNILTMI